MRCRRTASGTDNRFNPDLFDNGYYEDWKVTTEVEEKDWYLQRKDELYMCGNGSEVSGDCTRVSVFMTFTCN